MKRFVLSLLLVLVSGMAQAATLEIPTPQTTLSGIGVISGWKCEAGALTVRFNGGDPIPLSYGSSRSDVLNAGACDTDRVGFVAIWNYGELGDGQHTAVVYDDGVEFARSTFDVVVAEEAFLRGVTGSGTATLSNGQRATLEWSEASQSFVVTEFTAPPIETPTETVLPEGCEAWGTESLLRETPEWVQGCLDAGADPNARDDDGYTLLLWAVRWGNTRIVELLLGAGADPNVQGINEKTPLHKAAYRRDPTLLELLLGAGADPNVRDNIGYTPLHWAATGGNTPLVEPLLDAGANPDVRDKGGYTPLFLAARLAGSLPQSGHAADGAIIVELLLDAGADPNVRDNKGRTPLLDVVTPVESRAAAATIIVKLLLDAGADPNVRGYGGNTPLHNAADGNFTTIVTLLLDAGADPTIRNYRGNTPNCRHLDARCL